MKRTIKFLPLAAMTFVVMACTPKGNAYHVTFNTTGGSWKASETAYDSVDYKATFTPDAGHALDEKKLAIKVAGATIVDGYTFYDNQLVINKKMITGDVAIRATAEALTYGVSFKVEGVVPSYNKPTYHKEFVCTVSSSYDRYLLPNEFHVAVNGIELTDGVTYTRGETGETGKIVVDASKVEGDIAISGNPIKSAQVIFNGNGGKWGIEDKVDVYLPEGSTFRDAKTKAGNPVNDENSLSLRRWVIKGTDKTVSDDMVLDLNNPLEVEAKWTTKTFSLNIEDSYRYFPSDYYRKKIPYGTNSSEIQFDLVINEEDRGSHYLPDNGKAIIVEMDNTYPATPVPFTYTTGERDDQNRVVSAHLVLKGTSEYDYCPIVGNITVKIAAVPYQDLKVTFDPGDGEWSDKTSDPVVVDLPNDRFLTILEASLKADNMQMPVSKNPSRIFKCWTLDGEEVDNENKFISSSVTYKAKYADITFENDTWEHVISAADQGLDYVYNRYGTDATNIISMRRKVLIGNEKAGYINVFARVIGVNHDLIVGENAKAALTFDFEDTFGQGIVDGKPKGVEFSTNGDRDYKNSTIRNLLNNTNDGLITMVPDALKKGIKEVIKTTIDKNDKSENLADKFFLLSANELGLTHNDMPDGKDVPGSEGSPYALYFGAQPSTRAKGSQIVQDSTYWLRTSSTVDDNAYVINGDGECENETIVTPHGVAPGFAIGVANYTYATDGTITYTNCYSTINSFKVGVNTRGEFYALKATARSGYIFDESSTVKVTNGTLGYKDISDDGSTLTCSFSYTAEQTKNPISVEIATTTQGKSAKFNLLNCTTTAKENFAVAANKTGTIGTGIVFTAMDGYTFVKSDRAPENFDYDAIVYDIDNVVVSDDSKTLTCDIKYDSIALEGLDNIDITVNTKNNELSYIKLNAVNCSSDFTPKLIEKYEDKLEIKVTADHGCEFEKLEGETTKEQYRRSIGITAADLLGATYDVKEVEHKAKQELIITVSYKAASGAQLSDITVNATASKIGTCTITGNNCVFDEEGSLQLPYYYTKSTTLSFTATADAGYTFLDLYDTEIVIFKVDTLRGAISIKVSVSEDGKTADITITLDGTATREGNKLGFSVNTREAK